MGEWNGPWSDGSKEWTPYWLKKLGHTFGDDGVFWMSYKDMLETFSLIHRTRLFDRAWTVVQQWTSAHVSWVTGYLLVKFGITVHRAGTVVVVLSQLDDRYFCGFEGEYWFELHFVLRAAGAAEHVCRVRPAFKWDSRSVSCEVDLAPGEYEVLPKIAATRAPSAQPVEAVVRRYAERNPQKLRQVGMSYDLAHAKGGVPDEDALLEGRRTAARQKKDRKKQKERRKKALAKAVQKAQEALSEVVKAGGGDAKAAPEGEAAAVAEKPAGEAQGTTTNGGQQPTPEPEPVVAGAVDAAQSAPEPQQPEKDAAPAPAPTESKQPEQEKEAKEAKGDEGDEVAATTKTEKAEEKKEKVEEKADENKDDESEDEEESSGSSDSSDSDSDSDSDAEPKLSPWNAVAVVGLRVYARDPDVAVSLIKPTETDEVTNLTVEGKPAGATI